MDALATPATHTHVEMKDQCYYSVKSRVSVFPSARASQMIAKCRKKHHQVRKTAAGSALKQWGQEKWVDTKTGRPCGSGGDGHHTPADRLAKCLVQRRCCAAAGATKRCNDASSTASEHWRGAVNYFLFLCFFLLAKQINNFFSFYSKMRGTLL